MRNVSFFVVVCFLLLCPAFLHAQTAAELEEILNVPSVSYGQAAQFVVGAVDGYAGSYAFNQAAERGWLPKGAEWDDSVTMGGLSFLIMRAFDIKGGMMYTILPGPRYAFRSMVARSLIQGNSDPSMSVSGERFLQILGNVLSFAGGE